MLITILLISTIINVSATSQLNQGFEENNHIFNNSPPDKPIIKVPDKIIVGRIFKVEAEFTDPDDDSIYIRFDAPLLPPLPNFWLGPFPSGIVYEVWVTYRGPTGSYEIGVQSKDIHEAESEWTYVSFNVTKSKDVQPDIHGFFQKFIDLFPLFRLFLNRFGY
jgi:hypothetical protein